ncbi:M15 family metallopeptidase [Sinomicrobium soli]|uniref:M15 family metallopeptidase n=1 Tax=Sinomicrobium sp. N-1-3-6 TaxID=2219864 RepID=UPI000DCD907E|nr:M15 family metallopeptidase [Sinomicrobium sp. N-1-3-6]RAV30110.1 D-alanyl-D-alanine carboxypeptidase family protein [Sinomicrobium sp. N-1-3-6]
MKRRNFMKSVTLAAVAAGSFPVMAAGRGEYSYEELIGKGTPGLFGDGIQLRLEASRAFEEMRKAAAGEGIGIKIVSGYRTFRRQKAIWERKYQAYTENGMEPSKAIDRIIEYSTIPGTSRHHWATDIDIIDERVSFSGNDLLNTANYEGNGAFSDLKNWMDKNAAAYGYYLAYTDRPGRRGFYYEPWHYSYAPLSVPMLRAYRELDVKAIITREKVAGALYFTDGFIDRYTEENILDINPVLLP